MELTDFLKDNIVVWKDANNAELVIDLLPHIFAKGGRKNHQILAMSLFINSFTAPGVNERESLVAAIGGLHPTHLDAALASPHIARRSTRLSSCPCFFQLAPAVRIDRVDHDFARVRRHKTECRSSISGRFLGYPDIWLFRELVLG